MGSEHGITVGAGDRVVVFGPVRQSDSDDPYAGDSFPATVTSDELSATRIVFMFRHDWVGLVRYFHDLANGWTGFDGERVFQSVEHDLEIRATSDGRGHNRFTFVLRDGPVPTWSAQLELDEIAAGEDTASLARRIGAWAGVEGPRP